jgi:hypothetical protein
MSIQRRPSNNDPSRDCFGVIRLARADDVLPAFHRRCWSGIAAQARRHWVGMTGMMGRNETQSLHGRTIKTAEIDRADVSASLKGFS